MPAELNQELFPLLNNHFIRPLCLRLQEAGNTLETMTSQANLQLDEPAALLRLAQQQAPQLPPLPTGPTPTFNQHFSVLIPSLETWLMGKPEYIEEEQQEDRFKSLEGDPLGLRLSKLSKQGGYLLSRLPRQVKNRFRKESKPPRMWQHRIPWRNMLRQQVMVNLLHKLQPLVQSAEQLQQQLYLAAREASELAHRHYTDRPSKLKEPADSEKQTAEWQDLLQKSRELQRYIEGESRIILSQISTQLAADYPRAGTFELPEITFAPWRTQRYHQQQLSEINKLWQEWQQAHRALISQWHLRLAIYTTVYRWQLETQQLRQAISQGLSEEFWPAFAKILDVLQGLKKQVAQQQLAPALQQARQEVREQLQSEKIRDIVGRLISQDLAGKVQRLEAGLAQATEELPEQATVAKNGKVNEPLRQAELASLHPQQLISLEVLPKATSQLVSLKVGIIQGVEEARERLLEMEDVCLFNLDSAQAYLLDHPEEEAKARAIAFEGLDRTINQTRQVEQRLHDLEQEVPQEVDSILNQLFQELLGLRQANQLWSLQLRLIKAKALQRSGNFLEQLEERYGTKIPTAIKQLESGLRWTRQQQTQLKSRLGLEAAPPSIATEVTDFLQETEAAQQRLPFVYRRLYNTEPLQEELFFVNRRPELTSLMSTYTRWKEGRYASLLVIGEKGSGLTSLFNIFLKKLPSKPQPIRLELPLHPTQPAQLYRSICESFDLRPTDSLGDLVDQIKALPETHLVIAEDIQRLMTRQMGGFALLKDFMALVSATNRKVCWIASCNQYSWQYLQRATSAQDSWAQIMSMQAFTREQLLNLIMQRHRVSGYQLFFEASEAEQHSKKFATLSPEDRQKYLQDKFFQKLAHFSQSNLRLALLYWLRATISVSKNTITLSTSLDPEFSFLNSLSNDKYFTLHQLLLHDYLPVEAFGQLQQLGEASARRQLQTLYDLGLLVHRPEWGYYINPLLYRQIINVLKHRNLLH